MRITLLCFGMMKDLLPFERKSMELAAGETVEGLLRVLEKGSSNGSEVWTVLAVAVNREYAGRDTVLRDGDEVALLPPVSGGKAEA